MTNFDMRSAAARARANSLAFQSEVAGLRVSCAFLRLIDAIEREEKYRPDQPRVPAGNSDGGQWTEEGGGGRVISDATPDNYWQPGTQVAVNDGASGPDGGDDKVPRIPDQKPTTKKEQFEYVKKAAHWLAKVGKKLVTVYRVGHWIYEFYKHIDAYADEPRDLDELKGLVSTPETGYDIHHIAEQTPAEKEGYSRELIDGPDNLVRIPTLKHWEINGGYSRSIEKYGWKSPREYLRDKSWEEKQRVGLEALRLHGVLKQ